ncbi:hypothetical protein CMV_007619 [Castanea mollissima]|uniref:PGG domain-containing protein n=1 Tax=Castanea mollissima TaxID=60419 RepID=A0A8J4RDW9_9ROSI|nr:hypothetical protein CMV_007619 [Castanea mollissima]
MVRQLLQHNADLVRVKGREYVTIQNETALHIALKYDNLEAFKFLVGWLLRKWPYWRKILEQKDVEGNTVLHIAVSRNQTLAVSRLLPLFTRFVNINEKNLEGNTALDILEGQRRQGVDNGEMRVILDRAGALKASSLPTVTSSHEHYLRPPGSCERAKIIFIGNQVMKGITVEKRNALLVVATLLVTVSYQAVITPPGGLWQDDLFDSNTTDVLRGSKDDLFKLNTTAPHRAGSATARRTGAFTIFMIFNSIIFLSSIVTMTVLVPPVGIVVGFVGSYYATTVITNIGNPSYVVRYKNLVSEENQSQPLTEIVAVDELRRPMPPKVSATGFSLYDAVDAYDNDGC